MTLLDISWSRPIYRTILDVSFFILGITVNGELIGDKRANSDAKIQNTYFGKLGIANKHLDLKLTVTPEKITIQNGNEKTGFTWLDSVILQQEG